MESKLFTELTISEQANLFGGGNIYNSIIKQSNINITNQTATAFVFGSSVASASASNFNWTIQSNTLNN